MKITHPELMFWPNGEPMFVLEKTEPTEPEVIVAEDTNVIDFSDIKKRLASGGYFGGGTGGGNGIGTHTNYLQYIPKGAKFFAKARKTPSSFVLDQFIVYDHLPSGVSAIEPIIPGMDGTSIWHVDDQIFCNAYEHYITVEYNE